jgi:anti-sigma regulatory factor (Ser/Thr protein kinase)
VFRSYVDAAGLPARAADRAELLLEEIVMNVCMHGFDDQAGAVVDLCAQASPDGCTLVFEDAGRPFDPTAGALAERPTSLEETEPGGLGLVLLRRMASDLAYERTAEGRNRLSVRVVGQSGAAR